MNGSVGLQSPPATEVGKEQLERRNRMLAALKVGGGVEPLIWLERSCGSRWPAQNSSDSSTADIHGSFAYFRPLL